MPLPAHFRSPCQKSSLFRIVATATILSGGIHPLAAQTIADPIIPRGSLFLQATPSSQTFLGLYGTSGSGRINPGASFFVPELGVEQVSALHSLEERLPSLSGGGPVSGLRMGATRGRTTAQEQVVPLQLSYGVWDQITVGVTVPLVRRRVDMQLRYAPEAVNVGRNPSQLDPQLVSLFMIDANDAVAHLLSNVEGICSDLGDTTPDCAEGLGLVEEMEGFLSDLGATYENETLFPIMGTGLGDQVADRWSSMRARANDLGASPPNMLPMASGPLSEEEFRSLVVAPAWPGGGFPLDVPPALFEVGDVELHLSVGVPDVEGRAPGAGAFQLRSSVTGTLRLPTGQPDSLRTIAPMSTPRGVGGWGLRWSSDIVFAHRLALLGVVHGGTYRAREMVLLAPDPDRIFSPGLTRAPALWKPGNHLALSLTPRVRIAPELSIGAGWTFVRRGADQFQSLDASIPVAPPPGGNHTTHFLSLELRYSAMQPPASEIARFPFELFLRVSRSVAGAGDWSPMERRVDAGARFRLRQ